MVAPAFFVSRGSRKRTGLQGGLLSTVFRVVYDPVTGSLKPTKPYVITAKAIALKAGMPLRVAWFKGE